MAPVKIKGACGHSKFKEGVCGNYQAILFMKNGKRVKLFFRSTEERESYYKTHLQGRKEYSKFIKYSVCSISPPTRTQRRCGSKSTRKKRSQN
jgi:hypothetical protein